MDESGKTGSAGENSLWGLGGAGGKRKRSGKAGAHGAGGGGGGDTPTIFGAGKEGRGGDGIFVLSWDELYIEDKITGELLTFQPASSF
jgi:hypothetical protein